MRCRSNMDEIDRYAQVIWDYMLMHHQLKKADGILVCGAKDTRGAKYAANLFLQGFAPWLICSGGRGRITKDIFEKTEAETCADIAIERGVPKEKIIIENQSTSTFENAVFTRRILEERGLDLKTCILVHKPYMERRAYATFRTWWPEKEWIVTSPPISFDEYATNG